MTDLFELTPTMMAALAPSTRTQAWHRRARERQGKMRLRYGAGPEGQCCRGCVHLIHVSPGARAFLKCNLSSRSHSEASDWRAKWPACGAYQSPDAVEAGHA